MNRFFLVVAILLVTAIGGTMAAQSRGGRAAGQPPSRAAASRPAANMDQLMRGIMFPNSNVIFAAQGDDPATIKQDADPSTAVNPLASVYGGWQAVENAGLALADTADLLNVPGRVCTNGKPVPVQDAEWKKFVEEMREAGIAAAAAARAKNQDQVLDVADKLTTSCSNCHAMYRDRGGAAGRCSK